MLLSAGVIAYLGAFSAEYRAAAVSGWAAQCASRGVPCSPHFSLLGALGDPVSLRQWAIWGLPKDDVSAANGIIVKESSRWPLCIDPQVCVGGWRVVSAEGGGRAGHGVCFQAGGGLPLCARI